MFEQYIWDFDGTLYDTYTVLLDSFMKALESYDIQANRQKIYQLLKRESSAAVATKYRLDFTEFLALAHQFEEQDSRLPVSYEGTKEILAEIVSKGGKNYIMTHRTVASAKEMLAKENLLPFFEEIVGIENNFPRKPNPSALNYLVDKYQMNSQKTVMIGDRLLDIKAGENAGLHTIFYDLERLLDGIQADYIVHSIDEMFQLI